MNSSKPFVAIIIVNWNGWKDTIECINSCANLEYKNYKIVIVDNGSNDNSEAILRNRIQNENIAIIQSGKNLGFAGGNNVGIKHIQKFENVAYFWLLNNDTTVDKKALCELVQVAGSDSSIGIVGSKIYYYDSPKLWFAGGSFNYKTGYITHLNSQENETFTQLCDVDFISGCSLMITSETLKEIGLLEEKYFLYFEDTDWNFEAQDNGFRTVYVPNSIVYHKVSQSVGIKSFTYYYYIFRNSLFFIKKYFPELFWRILLFRFLEVIQLLCKGHFVQAHAATKGIFHFFKNKSGKF